MRSVSRATTRAALGVAAAMLVTASASAAPAATPEGWLLAVRSDSACPDAAMVDRRTRDLLGLGAGVALRESVEILHQGTGLSVKLRGEDQGLLGERVLPLDEDCDALARAVSVVLASWLTDAHPEFLAAAAPQPEVAAAPPAPAPAPPPAPMRLVPRVGATGVLSVDERLRLLPAVGLGALADTDGIVPVGLLGLGVAPRGSGLGLAARVLVSPTRTRPLGEGELELLRWPFALGGVVRLESGALSGELHAGAAVAWLHLRGRGFRVERSVNDVAFGLFGAARASLVLGVVEPFLELSAFGWPGAGSAFLDPPVPGVPLPRGELVPVAGAIVRM
jgi:hypothetical protein